MKQHTSVDCEAAPIECPNSKPPASPVAAAVDAADMKDAKDLKDSKDNKSAAANMNADVVLCTTKGLTRASLAAHLAHECTAVLVRCPFTAYGCAFSKTPVPRAQLQVHLSNATTTGEHLLTLITALEEQKTIIAGLNKRVSELEAGAGVSAGVRGLNPSAAQFQPNGAGAGAKDQKDVKLPLSPLSKFGNPNNAGFQFVRTFTTPGGPNGLAITVTGSGAGATKRLYVCEWFNARVMLYDPASM
jgi:hypothetical protein